MYEELLPARAFSRLLSNGAALHAAKDGMPRETVTWAKVDRTTADCPAKEMLKLSAEDAEASS